VHIEQLAQAFEEPSGALFAKAWLGWRGDRLVPRRADMQLRDIASILDRMTLFEIRSPDEVAIRLAGTSLRTLVDFELTGRNFRDVTAPGEWPERRRRLLAMSSHPCGGVMRYRDIQPTGRIVTFGAVTLPLDSDRPDAPRLLLSCSSLLNRSFELPARNQERAIPVALSFTLVDLGAGVPELESNAT
jgi:hypothetical protein